MLVVHERGLIRKRARVIKDLGPAFELRRGLSSQFHPQLRIRLVTKKVLSNKRHMKQIKLNHKPESFSPVVGISCVASLSGAAQTRS